MKLRVRLNKRTSCLELPGDEPSLTELNIQIQEVLLPSLGISPDTEFTLSLNGKEPLSDSGQTLSSCGIVSGDLICVILPQQSHPIPSGRPANSNQQVDIEIPVSQSGSSGQNATVVARPEEEEVPEMESAPLSLEPMLLSEAEDGKVPHSLEMLHHRAQSGGRCDSLAVVAHLLMVETGFVVQGTEGIPGEMPAGWRAEGGIYRLRYSHPLCENSLVVLVGVPMSNVLVINATLKIGEAVGHAQKVLLKPLDYVTENWAGENAADVFRDLKKLSRIFKDQLVYPMIASARHAMNLPAAFGLTALPPELLLRVIRLLDVASVLALSVVSRDLHTFTTDPSLWRHLYRRDFRDSTSRPRDTNWKDLYKEKYKLRRKISHYQRPRIFHPVPTHPLPYNPFPYSPQPSPLYPPGIIGGRYDQHPNVPYFTVPRPHFHPIAPHPGPEARFINRPSSRSSANIRRGFI